METRMVFTKTMHVLNNNIIYNGQVYQKIEVIIFILNVHAEVMNDTSELCYS